MQGRINYVRVLVSSLVGLCLVTGIALSWATGAFGTGAYHPKLKSDSNMGPDYTMKRLPAPPKPPAAKPALPGAYGAPSALVLHTKPPVDTAKPPAQAKTWGNPRGATKTPGPDPSTLVVYDTTGSWGWLGQLYAMGAANLASHFGTITAEPVVNYQAGQVNNYDATIYIGSTYNEPIPQSFLNDVVSTTHPVIWAADNVWQLAGASGSAADTAFMAKYGWDPSTSYFDTTDNPTSVTYKNTTFTRNSLNGANILAPHITNPSLVTTLAQAKCASTCASIAQSTGSTFPWAVRSSNLTYIGEIPVSYINETDRYLIFSDLLFPALAPSATPTHQAMVRLEDVSPADNPATIKQFANYFYNNHIPFSVNVIPEYTDPTGYFNNGVPVTETIAQDPQMITALKYVQSHGGVLNEEGYTHQYSTIANPYTAVSGDDAEFYRAECSTTSSPPYSFESTTPGSCKNTDTVVWAGPLPGDSQTWAASRVSAGQSILKQAGLTASDWVTPHYFASAADYAAIDAQYKLGYERRTYVSGLLSGQPLNYSETFGQFFPYSVNDVYGERVIPENLGDYEPTALNGNAVRTAQNIINEAQQNLAVTQGNASFFYNPNDGLSNLQTIVSGIQKLGYTFVSPTNAQ